MLSELRKAKDIYDLAKLLKFKPKAVAYLANVLRDDVKYTEFEIPKKRGGVRNIQAPIDQLKGLQRALSDLIYDCLEQLPEEQQRRTRASYGYSKGRSIVDNADFHKNSRYILNVDIEDFFGSIHIGRVIGFFVKDERFKLHPPVAKLMAQIACKDSVLPQGAPSSPIISELIGGLIDARMAKLARLHGCKYSRYVDDLTFSTKQADFPPEIARLHHNQQGWMIGSSLRREFLSLGFRPNEDKTRVSHSGNRQIVTGLLANKKANTTPESRLNLRAMCHHLFEGKVPFRDDFFVDKKESQKGASRAFLKGRLAYQYFVDHQRDDRPHFERRKSESARDRLYRKFLLFDLAFPELRPRIITEGKTDILYLRSAFYALKSSNPRFVWTDKDGRKYTVPTFARRSDSQINVLGLHNGTPGISSLLHDYNEFRISHPKTSQRYPVVIIVDDDDGLDDVNKKTKKLFGVNIAAPSKYGPFYKLHKGLYLIKLSGPKTQKKVMIEDLLDSATKAVVLGGKTFSPKDIDDSKNFGKSALAEHVWKTRHATNFSGFIDVVDAIEAAFADYGFQGQSLEGLIA